jgi:hypothetical protein
VWHLHCRTRPPWAGLAMALNLQHAMRGMINPSLSTRSIGEFAYAALTLIPPFSPIGSLLIHRPSRGE